MARLPAFLWAGHNKGVDRSVRYGEGLILAVVGSWSGLSRSLGSSLGPTDQGQCGYTGLFGTRMMLPLGPVPREGPAHSDCTGWRNVGPVLWGRVQAV